MFLRLYFHLKTIDAYELSEKLSGHQLDEKEVERIAEDFIREQATLEFVDDMVGKMFLRIIVKLQSTTGF